MLNRLLQRIYSSHPKVKKIAEKISLKEAALSRCWASNAHKRLYDIQWSSPPEPEHFDHHIDLYYSWLANRNSHWLERGVFGSLSLLGGNLLDLACGDGFNARNFYSLRSSQIIACDFDPEAIETAKKKNAAPNIQFLLKDIRIDMPEGTFSNITIDGAIEHFTQEEIDNLVRQVKKRLNTNGIFSGYTIIQLESGMKSLSHHEYEFSSKEDLARFFTPYFKNVTVFETIFPDRHNLYFWASDGVLPFDSRWPRVARFSTEE